MRKLKRANTLKTHKNIPVLLQACFEYSDRGKNSGSAQFTSLSPKSRRPLNQIIHDQPSCCSKKINDRKCFLCPCVLMEIDEERK